MYFAAGALALMSASAFAGKAVSALHPEEAIPDDLPRMTSPGPYSDFITQLQERLHAQGFDAGPVNGDFGTKTQAALAQFQLSRALPASGMLDTATLAALDLGEKRGACDALVGMDKEACLQPGGSAEAAAGSSAKENTPKSRGAERESGG
jgi:hypothetical protein